MSRLYWVNKFAEGNLAIMAAPRPEARLDEVLLGWKDEGVDIVVSMIEHREMPGLVEAERALCEEFHLEFIWFPIRDKTAPASPEAISALAKRLATAISTGKSVAVHCRAGIGRSALLAATVLVHLKVDGAAALDMIAEARGTEVPETEAQRQWVLNFGKTLPPYDPCRSA
ncbi:MAG: dual specificity protein phosphatase family protein [Alphaproteobacteria bacterium]|nr:dual specificity protein phosphatase family protein [Alphaproteobacteria bacterium]